MLAQAGGQELADSGRPAPDADVPASGSLARLRKRLGGAGVKEVKRGTAAIRIAATIVVTGGILLLNLG